MLKRSVALELKFFLSSVLHWNLSTEVLPDNFNKKKLNFIN